MGYLELRVDLTTGEIVPGSVRDGPWANNAPSTAFEWRVVRDVEDHVTVHARDGQRVVVIAAARVAGEALEDRRCASGHELNDRQWTRVADALAKAPPPERGDGPPTRYELEDSAAAPPPEPQARGRGSMVLYAIALSLFAVAIFTAATGGRLIWVSIGAFVGCVALALGAAVANERRCPRCRGVLSSKVIARELLGVVATTQQVTEHRVARDRSGHEVGHVDVRVDRPVQRRQYRVTYRCGACDHQWTREP